MQHRARLAVRDSIRVERALRPGSKATALRASQREPRLDAGPTRENARGAATRRWSLGRGCQLRRRRRSARGTLRRDRDSAHRTLASYPSISAKFTMTREGDDCVTRPDSSVTNCDASISAPDARIRPLDPRIVLSIPRVALLNPWM